MNSWARFVACPAAAPRGGGRVSAAPHTPAAICAAQTSSPTDSELSAMQRKPFAPRRAAAESQASGRLTMTPGTTLAPYTVLMTPAPARGLLLVLLARSAASPPSVAPIARYLGPFERPRIRTTQKKIAPKRLNKIKLF